MPEMVHRQFGHSSRILEAFLRKVEVGPGCWLWTGGGFSNGYGQYRQGLAHRWAYQLLMGEIPPGQIIMHTCDNRLCVRPGHLKPGTHADNTRDMDAKGRRGKHPGHPRLQQCQRGHAEWHTRPDGSRYCIPCQRESYRRWKERNGKQD